MFFLFSLFHTCHVHCIVSQIGGRDVREEDLTAEMIKQRMTEDEWQTVYDMSQDKNLYNSLCSSLFPTIHRIY
jgi:DNA replication licensing factor MCM6